MLQMRKTMTEVIIFVLAVALLLYVLLGGADFGAGIVELLTGKKGVEPITKAIAPIWEANHVWLILAVVILFNGFPLVYTTMSIYLHIPLLIALIGIIIRGSSFTFRHYDVAHDKNYHHLYSWFFRVSSVITPFFLGIVMGAVILGRIPPSLDGDFVSLFIRPWLNWFTMATGLFTTVLFAWLASIYVLGEVHEESIKLFRRTSLALFTLLIFSGLLVFISAEAFQVHLFTQFRKSWISIGCVLMATLMVPLMWKNILKKNILWTRLLAGVITACILMGWLAVQYPVMIHRSNGAHLTVWNSQAPQQTMHYLMLALIIGSLIIFPSFAYLFRVFKFKNKQPVYGSKK
jgi:cytochrome bd ubiquinol oxidase subunit II